MQKKRYASVHTKRWILKFGFHHFQFMEILFNLQCACFSWMCGNKMAIVQSAMVYFFFFFIWFKLMANKVLSTEVEKLQRVKFMSCFVKHMKENHTACNGFSVGQFTWHKHTFTNYHRRTFARTHSHTYPTKWIENVDWVFVQCFRMWYTLRGADPLRLNIVHQVACYLHFP